MDIKHVSFHEYLGVEESNLLASIHNLRAEVDLFNRLDEIFKRPLSRLEIDPKEEIVGLLYLFTHFHLYFSMSCILRCHLSEAIASLRKAIDGGLTAYEIILNPGEAEKYKNRDSKFQRIKGYIEKGRKKNPASYPLAEHLLTFHDMGSELGSHVDISAFFDRVKTDIIDGKKELLNLGYFQYGKNHENFQFWCASILSVYLLIFRIFKLFFDTKFKIVDATWELEIEKVGEALRQIVTRYRN